MGTRKTATKALFPAGWLLSAGLFGPVLSAGRTLPAVEEHQEYRIRGLIQQAKYPEALALVERELQAAPGDLFLLCLRGMAQIRAGEAKSGAGGHAEGVRDLLAALGALADDDQWDAREQRVFSDCTNELRNRDKVGHQIRLVDFNYIDRIMYLAFEMRREKIEDLAQTALAVGMRVRPYDGRVRAFRFGQTKAPATAELTGASAFGGAGDLPFEMAFSNQAMMRWLTQMFTFPQSGPLVENGVMRLDVGQTVVHRAAKLSEGRQVRFNVAKAGGAVWVGTPANPKAAVIPPEKLGAVVLFQHVSGRIAMISDGRLVGAVAATGFDHAFLAFGMEPGVEVSVFALEPATQMALLGDDRGEKGPPKVTAEEKQQARTRYEEALPAQRRADWREVSRLLSEAVQLDPLFWDAYWELGQAYEKRLLRRLAVDCYLALYRGTRRWDRENPAALALAEKAQVQLLALDREGNRWRGLCQEYLGELKRLEPQLKGNTLAEETLAERIALLEAAVKLDGEVRARKPEKETPAVLPPAPEKPPAPQEPNEKDKAKEALERAL